MFLRPVEKKISLLIYYALIVSYLAFPLSVYSSESGISSTDSSESTSSKLSKKKEIKSDRREESEDFLDSEGPLSFEQIQLERLLRIRSEIIQKQHEITILKNKIKEEYDSITKLKLESDLLKSEQAIRALRFKFVETIANINLQVPVNDDNGPDISKDLKEIVNPVIAGFKKLSERPRRIQGLNDDIDFYLKKIDEAQTALEKLKAYKLKLKDRKLLHSMNKSIKLVETIQADFKIKLEDARFQILKLEKNEQSIVSTFSSVILDFITTKGKNLFLAFFVFVLFLWSFSIGRNRIISLLMSKISKEVEYPGQIHWLVRPLKVFYALLALIIAFFFAISTLYILNDWVLVTLVIFVIVAIFWSSKNYIPEYFEQFKIVLNLGSIREGERIVYNGLPWKIKSLGYHCKLINPALSGGQMRLSTKALLSEHSRPVGDTEPWFPTRREDWVELSDGTYGKIIMQSPEHVRLKLIGDEHKYIKTQEFLGLCPINLSQGFAVEFVFGVDYSHQGIIFSEVIPNFKEEIQSKLYNDFKENKAYIKELSIEFKSAGASSLDLRFFLKCEGPLASMKKALERRIQAYFVEICNDHAYIIPFNQLTLHMQKPME